MASHKSKNMDNADLSPRARIDVDYEARSPVTFDSIDRGRYATGNSELDEDPWASI